jgi:DNA-binding PadR family transcriptional regulator
MASNTAGNIAGAVTTLSSYSSCSTNCERCRTWPNPCGGARIRAREAASDAHKEAPNPVSLRYAIMCLLAHDPLSGYELMKLFDQSVGYFWHATHPQIYKELARLEKEGHVAHRSVKQRGRPTKKVYSLKDAGSEALLAWLRVPARAQRVKDEMMVKTFSCGLLSREEAINLMSQHRQLHMARLRKYEELDRFIRSGPVTTNRMRLGGYLTLRRGISYERGYVQWCEEAIDLLTRGEEQLISDPSPHRRPRYSARKPRG